MSKLFEYTIHKETDEPVPFCWKVLAATFATGMLLAIMAVCASCESAQADPVTKGAEVMLTLHLSLPGDKENIGTRAISANEESAVDISQLKVLVFKVENTSEVFCYEAPPITLQAGKYIVTLRQSQAGETYRLVVIANAGSKLPYIPERTLKSDALKMITFDATGKWNANSSTDYKPIPMWGEATAAQAITATTNLGSITLLRALARIDVGCALSGETAAGLANFSLKSISVYRTKSKGYVAPVNGGTITNNVVTSVSIPSDAGANGALAYTCSDGKSLIRTIYVAEVAQGSSSSDNVFLVVGGTYAGATHYYRVDLTSSGSYIPLKRNCRYIVNIKAVSNTGYATEAAALTGDKTLDIATSVSAEAWSAETAAGSGTITLP